MDAFAIAILVIVLIPPVLLLVVRRIRITQHLRVLAQALAIQAPFVVLTQRLEGIYKGRKVQAFRYRGNLMIAVDPIDPVHSNLLSKHRTLHVTDLVCWWGEKLVITRAGLAKPFNEKGCADTLDELVRAAEKVKTQSASNR